MSRIRLGMVGGGRGAFIGPVHRIASRLDNQYELVAAALSSDPDLATASATEIGIEQGRSYASYNEMAAKEAARSDGIEAVAIVTPNDTHAAIAKAFLSRGIHVICDKPLSVDSRSAAEVVEAAASAGKICALTYNYTGYPMVREARALCASGGLGRLRLVQVEYLQDWLAEPTELGGSKQAQWRTDPSRSGRGDLSPISERTRLTSCASLAVLRLKQFWRNSRPLSTAGAWTTMRTSSFGSKEERAGRYGLLRSRPVARTISASGSLVTEALSSGDISNPTISGTRL